MKLIDGTSIADKIISKLKSIIDSENLTPRLDIVYIGDNFASQVYIESKQIQAKKAGIETVLHQYKEIDEENLIELIQKLNKNKKVDGILVQLPIKGNLNTKNILRQIAFTKDVDGLSPKSLGYLWQWQKNSFAPATALAVIEVLKYISLYPDQKHLQDELDEAVSEAKLKSFLRGKDVLIINHSNLVGKPLAAILLKYNSTITIAHKYSKKIETKIRNSEIIISGTGKPGLIKGEYLQDGQILIDIGINKTAEGIGGDVDKEGLVHKEGWLTPVPGGIGPLTVAKLLENVVEAHQRVRRKSMPSI